MNNEQKRRLGFERVQEVMKHRWVPEILTCIGSGEGRYSEILEKYPFLSKTELNRKLALLKNCHAIEKSDDHMHLPYTLLDFGEDLLKLIESIEAVGSKYV